MMAGMSIDMFIEPDKDPRTDPPGEGSELATLTGFLDWYRKTLELKCSGLDAGALARRSVEPSKMSLLGLIRHMSDVERGWFRWFMAGEDADELFSSSEDRDGAKPDPAVVEEAWAAWREEVAFAEQFVAAAPSLEITGQRDGRSDMDYASHDHRPGELRRALQSAIAPRSVKMIDRRQRRRHGSSWRALPDQGREEARDDPPRAGSATA